MDLQLTIAVVVGTVSVITAVVKAFMLLIKIGRGWEHISAQVSNHIPTSLRRLEEKLDVNSEMTRQTALRLDTHERREEEYLQAIMTGVLKRRNDD